MTTLLAPSPALERVLTRNRFIDSPSATDWRREVEVEDGPCPGRYEIAVATSEPEILQHLELRYTAYSLHGYLNPDYSFPDDLEYETHDEDAALFLAREEGTSELRGVARLAYDVGGILPMDTYYSLDRFREEIGYREGGGIVLAEFSRLISHPTGQKALNRALVRSVFEFAVKTGATYVLGCGRCDIRSYYDKWGFHSFDPDLEIDLRQFDCQIQTPMPLYPHYMHVREIRWERI